MELLLLPFLQREYVEGCSNKIEYRPAFRVRNHHNASFILLRSTEILKKQRNHTKATLKRSTRIRPHKINQKSNTRYPRPSVLRPAHLPGPQRHAHLHRGPTRPQARQRLMPPRLSTAIRRALRLQALLLNPSSRVRCTVNSYRPYRALGIHRRSKTRRKTPARSPRRKLRLVSRRSSGPLHTASVCPRPTSAWGSLVKALPVDMTRRRWGLRPLGESSNGGNWECHRGCYSSLVHGGVAALSPYV